MQRFFVYPEWLDSHNPKDKVEVVKCSDHEQALAEKDREITHLQDVYTKQRFKLEDAYQQLMEKAVRFAEDVVAGVDDAEIAAAVDFIKSPEVQAWKEQQAQQIARLENGLGCSRSHPHEDMNQICELRTEVARLNNELSHWSWVRFKQLEEENAKLRKALKE